MDEPENKLVEETKKQMDIVPYTRRDRNMTFLIFLVVCANFLLLLWAVPWTLLF